MGVYDRVNAFLSRQNNMPQNPVNDIGDRFLGAIRVVLIGTTEAGNIGAAARAMKTMGLSRLVLVAPAAEFPSARATARASGADDVLARAVVTDDLDDALAGCGLVMGTSARVRDLPWPMRTPREAAQKAWLHGGGPINDGGDSKHGDTAILFGCERSGLTNEQMDRCHFQVHIPADSTYSSLNLAAAVQLVAYEIRMAWRAGRAANGQANGERPPEPLAAAEEMAHFYRHLFNVMRQVGYDRSNRPKLSRRVRRMFNRAMLTHSEAQILRGFLSMLQGKLDKH